MDSSEPDKLEKAMLQLSSKDFLAQQEGVGLAIQLGPAAVPQLLEMFKKGPNRAQAMYALTQIGDRSAAAAFAAGLHDPDERIRSYSAYGLARIGDPQALRALLQTLDDAPDEVHLDITPSVQALGTIGLQAAPALLDLLMAEKEITRLHAQRALEWMLATRHGFVPDKGYPSPEAAEAMRSEWRANGDYAYSASFAERAAAGAKWRKWLAEALEKR